MTTMKRTITIVTLASGLIAGAGVLGAPAQAAPSRMFTKAEVARHGTASDCWVYIGRNVYDMTAYLPRHPGGADEIAPYCGGNAKAAFLGEHAGDGFAKKGLATLKIGRLKR